MSALDDLFDGHYFTEDPHVYIPIDEAQQELAELRARIAELEKENERSKEELALVQDHFQVTHSINVGLNNENVHLQARIAELENPWQPI